MADELKIIVRAILDVDPTEAAKSIDSKKGAIENNLRNSGIKVPLDVDPNDAQTKIKHTLSRIRTQNAIEFPIDIDTAGMDKQFTTVQKQLDNYEKKIRDAGGAIKQMRLSSIGEHKSDGADGQIISEQAYRAVLTYQTAIGETVQKIVEFTESGEVLRDTVNGMSINFEKQRKDFNSMGEAVGQYGAKLAALKKQAAGVLTGSTQDNSFKNLVDSIDFSSVGTQDELNAMIDKFKQAQEIFRELNASIEGKKLAGTALEQMNTELAKMPATLEKIKTDFAGISIPEGIQTQIDGVEQGLRQIDTIGDPQEKIALYSEMMRVLGTIPAQLENIRVKEQQQTQELIAQQKAVDALNKLSARYEATGVRYSAFQLDPALNAEYQQLGQTISNVRAQLTEAQKTGVWNPEITRNIQSANAELSVFSNHVVSAGKNTKSFGDQLKNAFSKFGVWMSSTTIFMKVIQGFKQAVVAIKEIDAAMTNLKKVTDETNQSYDTFLKKIGKTAQRIGSTMSDLVESTATFAKLGYSFKDAQALAEVATVFNNVGDFNNIETATSGLITAMKAFRMDADEAMGIADRINEVANKYAVSADDLTTGLANASSALNLAGNNIDQTLAMITAMSEITQNASESGNALKILSMRLRGAKAELDDAGEETDGMCESSSRLREKILALTGSVDIMADTAGTQFKSTYDIMKEISVVWDDLTDINQAALLETIAGKQRGNSISALLTSMAQADKVLKTSMKSSGSAMSEHEKWMESIEAKENQMMAAWQDFSNSFLNSDAVGAWYQALTGVLDVLTEIIDRLGTIPTLAGAAYAAFSVGGKGLFGTAKNSSGETIGRVGSFTTDSIKDLMTGGIFSKVDVDVIERYNVAITDGKDATEAMVDALTNEHGALVKTNSATMKVMASAAGATVGQTMLGTATAGAAFKAMAATVAWKALSIAMNAGVTLLISLAVSGIIKLFESLTASAATQADKIAELNKQLDTLRGEYEDIKGEIDEVNDELEYTNDRIKELQAAGSLSFVEKGELDTLKASNKQLEARLENLKKIEQVKQEGIRRTIIEKYTTDMLDSNEYAFAITSETAKTLNSNLTDSLTKWALGGNRAPYKILQAAQGATTFSTVLRNENDEIAYQIELFKQLGAQGYDNVQMYEELVAAADLEVEKLVSVGAGDTALNAAKSKQNAAKAELALAKQYADAESFLRSEMEKLYTEYLDLYGIEDEFTKGIQGTIDQIDKALNPAKYKTDQFNEIIGLNEYKTAVSDLQQLAKDGITAADIKKYPALANALSHAGITAAEAAEQFSALAVAEKEAIVATTSFETIRGTITSIDNASTTLLEVFGKQGYSASITAEQYDSLVEAGQQYADCVENINGYMQLNIDAYTDLIAKENEATQASIDAAKAQRIDQYKQNIEAISSQRNSLEMLGLMYDETSDEYAKHKTLLLNGLVLLEKENAAIIHQINGYDRLTSQLRYATSSYKAWIDAQNAPDAGEAYNSLFTAMEQINEGQETGKIGTARYKAAVELLVPDGRDISAYMATLEKYLTEDSTGLQNFINDMYSRANPFLSKGADGRYSFMQGVSVQDIAAGLGLTDETARYMLQALEDYGWDVNILDESFSDTAALQAYHDATVKLAEAQAELDAVMADTNATIEARNAALEKRDNLAQDEVTAAQAAGITIEKSPEQVFDEMLAKWQSIITEMDALEIPVKGVIEEYINKEGVDPNNLINTLSAEIAYIAFATGIDPNTLIASMNAYIASYANGEGVDPNGLLSAMKAVVSIYENGDEVNPDTLVSTLKAVIATYSNTGDPNTLVAALSAVVTAFTSSDSADPDTLVDAMSAVITGYSNADGVDPTGLVSALSAFIASYQNGTQTDPNALVNALTAIITSFSVKEGTGTAHLSPLLDAVIATFQNADGVDPNALVQALTGIITSYANFESVDPDTLVNDLSAIITSYVNDETTDPGGLVKALIAYITKYSNSKGVTPDNLVSGLEAEVTIKVTDESKTQMSTDINDYLKKHPPQITPEIIPPTIEEINTRYDALQQEFEGYNPETDGAWRYGSRTPEMLRAMEMQHWGYDNSNIEIGNAEIIVDNASPTSTPTPTPTLTPTPTPASSSDTIKAEEVIKAQTNKLDAYSDNVGKMSAIISAVKEADGSLDLAIQNLGTTMAEVQSIYQSITVVPPGDVLDHLMKFIEELADVEVTVGANTAPAERAAIETVRAINSKSATITVYGKYAGLRNTLSFFAKGTKYAKNEDAIVGENGVETIISNGQYYTVGHDGAELVHLNRGDQVLSNDETKKLFSGNGKRKQGNTYGLGTLLSKAKDLITGKASSIAGAVASVAATVGNLVLNVTSKGKNSLSGGGGDLGGNANTKKNTSNGGGGGGGESTAQEEKVDELVDWIPTALENLKKKTEEYIAYADKAVGYMLKNTNLDNAIRNIQDEVSLNLQAYDRYMQQAEAVASQMGLAGDIIAKIKNGALDIQLYDEDTRKAITEYEKWYSLAIDCRDAITDLKDKQYELATQKLDNIATYYENRINLLGTTFETYQKRIDKKIASGKEVIASDYNEMLENTRAQIQMIKEERDALNQALNSLVSSGTIKEGSDDWYSYTTQIEAFDNAIADAEISMEKLKDSAKGIVLTNLQSAMDTLAHVHDTIQGLMDLRKAQGKTAKDSDFKSLISSSAKQIENLKVQNEELRKQQVGLDILSEKYIELQRKIEDNDEAILSAKTQQEEWNDAMIDLKIDALRKQNDEYKNQIALMDAIEELERAKQRRSLVYHEGKGFVYEAAQDDVLSAQRALDELLFEQQLKALEDSKADNNLYDDFGNELLPIHDLLSEIDLHEYYKSIASNAESSASLAEAIRNLDIHALLQNIHASSSPNFVIESGAISLSGVNDVNSLAEAIINYLPNAILQEIYSQ